MNAPDIAKLVISSGESAGIGPEICLSLADHDWPCQNIVLADPFILKTYAEKFGKTINFVEYDPKEPRRPSQKGEIIFKRIIAPSKVHPGKLNPDNSSYVINMLSAASRGCISGEFDAVVTGPVHKGIINEAGFKFTGHTEFFRDDAGARDVVMMLATEGLRVALATTHLPIRDLPKAITPQHLRRVITILHTDLSEKFGIDRPRIYVCGLNPHAGEGGHLGTEELTTIIPIIRECRKQGMDIIGPMPADTVFQKKYMDDADAILAMYHDQGLPVLKYMGFGRAVNVTLGLPFIRTSVDHGTALDLAGTGKADPGSLYTAIDYALGIIEARNEGRARRKQ